MIAGAGALACIAPSSAIADPPRNDNYLSSFTIIALPQREFPTSWSDAQDTSLATTQSDVFDFDKSGNPLGGGPPETTRCGQTEFSKTVWYDYAPPISGGVELTTSGFATAITVYEYDPATSRITREVACQVGGPNGEDFVLPREALAQHYYTVQVGGVGAGASAAAGALAFHFAFYPDRDADGVLDAAPDKCPLLPGVGPFGGCPPTLNPSPSLAFGGAAGGIRVTRFVVNHVPSGARVEARCRRCGLRQAVRARPGSHTTRMTRFVGKVLPAGSSLEIWVTRARTGAALYRFGAIGSYFRIPIRAGGVGTNVARCLLPNSRTPQRRCR